MGKDNKTKELVQTRGRFSIVGHVNRIDNDNAFKDGTLKSGKYEGHDYQSLRFGVKTSLTNEIFVELFGIEGEDVYAYKPPTKEERAKNKKAKGKTVKLSYEDRYDIPDGHNIVNGVRVSLERDDDNKLVTENLMKFEAVETIYETLEDGDSVFVSGTVEHSEYINQEGKKVKQTKYILNNISKTKKPVDLEAEDFEETASFSQEIVFVDKVYDKKTKKLQVIGRVINYDGTYIDKPFIINTEKKELADIAKAFNKNLKFGDFVEVVGLCHNRALTVEVEDDEVGERDSIFGGGGATPKGQQKRTVTEREVALEITDIARNDKDKMIYELGKYKEEDFVNSGLVEEDDIDEDEDEDNPFEDDDNDNDEDEDGDDPFEDKKEPIEVSEDDLPF